DLEQHDGLITSLGLAGIYLGFRLQQTSAEQVARTLVWWLAAAALASVYAVLQAVHLDVLDWSRTAGYGTDITRPFGTLGHPNTLGAVCAAALAVVVTLPLRPGRTWLRPALGALFAVAAALTFSRSAWLASALALACAWPLAALTRARIAFARPRWPTVAVVLTVAALLAFGPWGAPLRARLGEIAAPSAVNP